MTPALIGVDWGTTVLRCHLIAGDGTILDSRTMPDGIMAVPDGRFGATLADITSGWRNAHAGLPVVMSGMIGSRQGWHEVPYVACPASLQDVAVRTVPCAHPGIADIRLVPGLMTRDGAGLPDVMRGEETQIFGALQGSARQTATIVLPGTHSKWAVVENGAITRFQTFMTGEVFAALRHHTILGRLMTDAPHAPSAFERGLHASGPSADGALLGRLFTTRSLALFGELAETATASYLSGLLLGAEIRAASAAFDRHHGDGITIIASPELGQRYLDACRILEIPAKTIDETCVVWGHLAIATVAGLIGQARQAVK